MYNKTHKRQQLKAGDNRYLGGSKTKVQIMKDVEKDLVCVQILRTGRFSKYRGHINHLVYVPRKILYLRGKRLDAADCKYWKTHQCPQCKTNLTKGQQITGICRRCGFMWEKVKISKE
jgi:hypothetical protein